ncbi:MAG: hypothetical protein WKG01_30280 [Kofleriaceae bacterium]
MSRLLAIALVAACGGSGADPLAGGTVTGSFDDGTGPVTFDDDCEFSDSGGLLRVTSSGAQTGVEVTWDPSIVDQPATYTTSGIVPDLTISVRVAGTLRGAEGTVTFGVLDNAAHVAGSLELTAGRITGTAQFDCTR